MDAVSCVWYSKCSVINKVGGIICGILGVPITRNSLIHFVLCTAKYQYDCILYRQGTSCRPNDPWRLLDPHDPGPSQARPISTSRTYRLPSQLRRRRGSNYEKEGVTEIKSTWVGLDGKLV